MDKNLIKVNKRKPPYDEPRKYILKKLARRKKEEQLENF